MGLTACRSCGSSDLNEVLSLGEMPLANALLDPTEPSSDEARYPLTVVFCGGCTLLQLTVSVPPRSLFEEYAYFSSRSEPMVQHARHLVNEILESRPLDGSSLAIEIASNDGYLLQHYRAAGVPVLGIDPAVNVVDEARAKGIPTECAFLTLELAEQLRDAGTRADVVHANNVLAHVPDINDFVAAIARLLRDDGVAVIETPYVHDLVANVEFDTIYHEHVFYYSVAALETLFQRNGLTIAHLEHVPIHGGSLRITAAADARADSSVRSFVEHEQAIGMTEFGFYEEFGTKVHDLIGQIRGFLLDRKARGRRIAGYGAAAKATVMLNALDIGPEVVEFVVDNTPYKQGRLIPGIRIPIEPPSVLTRSRPDDIMIFAWNFAASIIENEPAYVADGGTFLMPLPEPHEVA